MTSRHWDVLIVGAGLSGIGAAYRIGSAAPDRDYAIFEARGAIGGTWDLFRYPGVRSDSDMHTLGYPFRPWTRRESIADGASIREYIRDTAAEHGIDRHIRFHHRVVAAAWSSAHARWTVEVEVGPERRTETHTCSFLYLCSGYYDYDHGHVVDFPGQDRFRGRIVHPQHWPADLSYRGERVVVVGSGATAVTLVPSMAEDAAHVTMLQRSPSYIASRPDVDPLAERLRAHLPDRLAYRLVRGKNILTGTLVYRLCRRWPRRAARVLRDGVAGQLPDSVPLDPHFAPRYDPWDQRLCLVPNGDLFRALRDGRASVVTDGLASFTEHGVRLASGAELAADVVVTATGLEMLAFGGIDLTVDGEAVDPGRQVVYKGVMFSGVPNLAWSLGYTNASWTLRSDLTARYVRRVLDHMRRHGHTTCLPRPRGAGARRSERPILDLSSGYVMRAADRLPKQGARRPWRLHQNYLVELPAMRLSRVDDGSLLFSRTASAPDRSATTAPTR
ncbi:NAD(P)/FAD-dependent oxidoreductase [Saccharopolyspora cebuensis]|uniref:Flavin-containing monooxygenase n=1 Tax=Saccharopolyspora cebuensis TaxID=418759 RepID=A0ABV4CDN9_9PSEU